MAAWLTVYARAKGSSDEYQVAATCHYMDMKGYDKILFRVDPEPSTLDVQKAVCERRTKTTMPRQSPKGSKGSLGGAEAARIKGSS